MDSSNTKASNDERSKNVQDLLQVLLSINVINGGSSDTASKMKIHAKNFEAALFAKSSSKKEYMDNMREKVNSMRNTLDTRKKDLELAKRQQQQQQQQSNQNNTQNNTQNSNQNFPQNMNPQMFLNQQAQVRQQVAQQLRNQQQQQQSNQNQNQNQFNNNNNTQQPQNNNNQRPQFTPQQQQIINQMKIAPIPRELLQRLPNIPPNVNTWQQITELAQQNRLTQQDMKIAKDIYKIHQQLLYKAKVQQQRQQQQSNQNSAQNNNTNRNIQQQPQQPPPNSSNDNNTQQQRSASQDVPNVLGQINQIFSSEEQRVLLHEAMEACKDFQKSHFGNSVNDFNKQAFVRKYINQKALRKIQAIKIQQQMNNNSSNQSSNNNTSSNSSSNTTTNSAPIPTTNNNNNSNANNNTQNFNNQYNNNNMNMNNNNNNTQNFNNNNQYNNMNQNNQQRSQNNNNNMNFNNNNNMQKNNNIQSSSSSSASSLNNNQYSNNNNNNNTNNAQKQQRSSIMQSFQPTQQDIEIVKRISNEAANTPLRLSDITNILSPQEKDEIKRKLQMNQQLFAQVSNYTPQVYILTRNENFLKEVLQLRIFVKEIIEKCAKGIFVVKLDTVEKLIMKYQKYWESMKIQILRRQQAIEQQRQQQQQQQQQQSSQKQQQQPQQNSNIINDNLSQTQQRVQGSLQQIQNQLQYQQSPQNQNNVPPHMSKQNYQKQQGKMNSATPSNPVYNTAPPLQATGNLNDHKNSITITSPINNNNPSPSKSNNNLGRKPSIANSRKSVSSSSKKQSPTQSSNNNTPVPTTVNTQAGISSLANTPNLQLGNSPSLINVQNKSQQQQSPSPLSSNIPPSNLSDSSQSIDNPFKDEEMALKQMHIRKAEVISRFKHRKELLSDSPADLFLSTMGDCLGLKDEDIELIKPISQNVADYINGVGKKKVTKAVQKTRDQDVVTVSVDNNRLIMKSKTNPNNRSYKIDEDSLFSMFSSICGEVSSGADILNDKVSVANNHNNNTERKPSLKRSNSNASFSNDLKKRKLSELEVSPANSNASPSSFSMSESKKIKIDSPEDMFNSKPLQDSKLNENKSLGIINENEPTDPNIWDWGFWSNLP